MEKLREEHETYQEEQAVVVAIAAGACCCTQGLGLGGGCGIHCPGGLSPGGDAVGLLATACDAAGLLPTGWGCAAAVSAPMARCRSSSAVVAMITPITSPSVA